MDTKDSRIKTQVRFSRYMWDYITSESERLGMSKNAVIIKIIEDSIKRQKKK